MENVNFLVITLTFVNAYQVNSYEPIQFKLNQDTYIFCLGYTGPSCSIDVKECSSNPCINNSTCSEPFLNMFLCSCQPGYTGTHCETVIQVCESHPCLNNATCTQLEPNKYKCSCPPGFTGKLCETQLSLCLSKPCKNGATCYDSYNSYKCICLPGFEGVDCEVDINPCKSNPCRNNGTCLLSQMDQYICKCPNEYSGINCENAPPPVNVCLTTPCQNNGVCLRDQNGLYRCVCIPGFTGELCQNYTGQCPNGDSCFRNLTSQVLNVYGTTETFLFSNYEKCILDAWNSINPTRKFLKIYFCIKIYDVNLSFLLTNSSPIGEQYNFKISQS